MPTKKNGASKAKGSKALGSDSSQSALPDRDAEIRARAYLLWLEEGQPDGRGFEHWVRAEQDVDKARRRVGDKAETGSKVRSKQKKN